MKIILRFLLFFIYLFAITGCSNFTSEPLKMFTRSTEEEKGERVSDVINWAKDEGYLEELGISEESADVLFKSMLINHNLPKEIRNNDKLRNELMNVAIEEASKSAPIHPEEAERAIELIQSGEIFEDIFYSLNVSFSLVVRPERFSHMDEDFKDYLTTLPRLSKSFISDINPQSIVNRISNQITLVKEGSKPENPEILNNTLKTIYSTPAVSYRVEGINTMLAPENETIRLVLLVYARLNGINLEQQDIDMARNTILNKDEPDLGALFLYLLTPENAKRLAGS